MIGGRPRTIDLVAPAPEVAAGASDEYSYRAVLDEREYGSGTSPAWSPMAGTAGRGRAPGELRLRFEGVAVPAGVRRLRLRLTVGRPGPA